MQGLLLEKNDSAGNPTGEYIIAFRGTQETFDIGVAAIIGLNNVNLQFDAAKDFVQQMMTEHNITAFNLTLTGHSLGGILTQSVGAVLGVKGYAFNSYGTERLLTMCQKYSASFAEALINVGIYQVLNAFGLSSSYADFAKENILNISFNDCGDLNGDILSNFASALSSDHLGTYLPIFGDNFGIAGHKMGVLNQAISYYNSILVHFTEETTYENLSTAYALGGDDGYNRVNEIFNQLGVYVAASESLQFRFLFDKSVDELKASDVPGMFALQDLIPFTIVGADYSHLNVNGELDRNNYSDQYIEDRAKFLYYIAHPDENVSNFDPDIDFVDNRLGISRTVDNGMMSFQDDSQYLFGTLEGELLEGVDEIDHLYGMGGNDILSGFGGNDYIEGGKGQDIMDGDFGNDTFYIMGEDEAYDTFYGGSGDEDTILDSDGDDTIRVNNFDSLNSIENIDGGGVNTIAGIVMADIIDLTGITVEHIDTIKGGWGNDLITGTTGDDIIYGGESSDTLKGMGEDDTLYGTNDDGSEDYMEDRLEGGEGNDAYHVGAGDVISDSDNQGTIWFNGKQLPNLTLTRMALV
jgi:hypothetical protein